MVWGRTISSILTDIAGTHSNFLTLLLKRGDQLLRLSLGGWKLIPLMRYSRLIEYAFHWLITKTRSGHAASHWRAKPRPSLCQA